MTTFQEIKNISLIEKTLLKLKIFICIFFMIKYIYFNTLTYNSNRIFKKGVKIFNNRGLNLG